MKSLNKEVSEKELVEMITELEEREEMACFLNACGVNVELCGGVACGVACFGIGPCALGLHVF